MIRRFCSLCVRRITEDEIFYDVSVSPKKGVNSREWGDYNYNDDFCYDCSTTGKALIFLMDERNNDLKKKGKKNDLRNKQRRSKTVI